MKKMLLLFLTYAIAPVVAGHGILPMGLTFLFPIEQMALPFGAAAVVSAGFVGARIGSAARPLSQLGGTIILYCAWVVNVHIAYQSNTQAEQQMALESMLLFSLPFQITTIWVFSVLVRQAKPRPTRHDPPNLDK